MRALVALAAAAILMVAAVAVGVHLFTHQGPSDLEREAHRRAVLNCRLTQHQFTNAYQRCVEHYTARYLDRLKDGHA
jgi:hypothetical protein